METRLTNAGIDLNLIKSQRDLDQALAFVKQIEDQVFAKQFSDALKPDAEIIPITDPKKRLDPNKPIMGGTQDDKDILQKSIDKNVKAATEKGDFTGIKNQLLRDPDIAREFAMMKKFPFRRDTNVLSGEDAIPLARKAKFDEEMGIKSLPDRDYSVEKLVSDFKKFGNATDKDIQMILKSGKSSQIPYVMDNYGMSYTDVINTLKRGDPLIEGLAKGGRIGLANGTQFELPFGKPDYFTGKGKNRRGIYIQPDGTRLVVPVGPDDLPSYAKGGRAGFKVGSPSKRAFLKVMGGLAATIAAIKSGLIGTPKEAAKQVVKESVKDVSSAPPDYFFNLANKIKNLGKESKVKPQERVNEYNYKGKDGSDYTLIKDITTGDMQIVKEKGGVGIADDKTFDIEDRTVMEYKAPKQDFDPDTEKILKEGAEYDEYSKI